MGAKINKRIITFSIFLLIALLNSISLISAALVERGPVWNKYDNNDGAHTLKISNTVINYLDGSSYTPIDATFTTLDSSHPAYAYGYRYGTETGVYSAYFKDDNTANYPIAFNVSSHVLRSKLLRTGWLNPSTFEYCLLPLFPQVTPVVSNSQITFPNIFNGVNITYTYVNTKLKEELICNANCRQALWNNRPSQLPGCNIPDGTSYFVLVTQLEYLNLDPYITDIEQTGNFSTNKSIEFKDALGKIKFFFPVGYAYDSNLSEQ